MPVITEGIFDLDDAEAARMSYFPMHCAILRLPGLSRFREGHETPVSNAIIAAPSISMLTYGVSGPTPEPA